jgi:hypothetical protein
MLFPFKVWYCPAREFPSLGESAPGVFPALEIRPAGISGGKLPHAARHRERFFRAPPEHAQYAPPAKGTFMGTTQNTSGPEKPAHQPLPPERAVHGAEWERIHGGYFSNPTVAATLTKLIQATAERAQPQAIVDLGGGTGFLLHELARRGLAANARLINLDASAAQLGQGKDPRVKHIKTSLTSLRRAQFAQPGETALFVMRSVLHHFGQDGLLPILKRLRRVMQPGESFIHQTTCFEEAAAAKCLNKLYELMGTDKWFPMRTALCMALMESGWRVEATTPAPPLPLNSLDLARCYNLAPAKLTQIQKTLCADCGECANVFVSSRRGFTAFLPFTIFTCIAV